MPATCSRALPGDRALLQAYADGVNAGLAALGARPPEYLLLRAQPAAWLPEDSVLVVGAMFGNDLENSRRELELQAMYKALPAPLVDFLRPLGDEWDAPLVGAAIVAPRTPGPEVVNLRTFTGLKPGATIDASTETGPGPINGFVTPAEIGPGPGDGLMTPAAASGLAGSNAWAIAGSHTADGRARARCATT